MSDLSPGTGGAPHDPPPHPLRILYLEDNAFIAAEVRIELEALGYHAVEHFASWEEASRALEAADEGYDAAILDIKLEGSEFNGVEAGVILERVHGIPCVFVTGLDDAATMERLRALPRAPYTRKPASAAQIHALLLRCLSVSAHPDPERQPATVARRLDDAKLDQPLVKFRRGRAERVAFAEIAYLHFSNGSVDVYLLGQAPGERPRDMSCGLQEAIDFFGRDDLLRIHKSYAVPYHAIASTTREAVFLTDGTELPIGATYRHGVYPK